MSLSLNISVCKTTKQKWQAGASVGRVSREEGGEHETVCEAFAVLDAGLHVCRARIEDLGERPRYAYTQSQVEKAATNIAHTFHSEF